MRNAQFGPVLLGVGMAILFAATWRPGVPVVTAIAITALGATEITIQRFRRSTAALPVLMLHSATYTLLYVLFICARLHASWLTSTSHLSTFVAVDLVASAFPMSIALKRIWSSLWHSSLSRH
jgi:hypothetical protein